MTDPERPAQLKDLSTRLQAARDREQARGWRGSNRATAGMTSKGAMGLALRAGVELAAALVVGGGIGWFLDRWLGISPVMLIVFLILGSAAGVLNVYRAAREINRPTLQDKDNPRDGDAAQQ